MEINDLLARAWGFDSNIQCHFYYDESNNCRKFWIRDNENGYRPEFNADPYADFVLAGVATKPGQELSPSIREMISILGLQKNVPEIKFKSQFSKGNFLTIMQQNRTESLLKWIEDNDLLIHCKYVNNLYYALVEIIDSVTSAQEIEEYGFDYFGVKNQFYKMLQEKRTELQEIMYRYEYPNLKKRKEFILDLLKLLPARYEQTTEEKFITGVIKRAEQSTELPFLENNTDYVMQRNYVEFYYDGARKFTKSMHTYDHETEVENTIKQCFDEIPKNMEFVDSKDNVLVQISDVIAGIWGKLTIYVNSHDEISIKNDVDQMTTKQIRSINQLGALKCKAIEYNKGLWMQVTAVVLIRRMEYLFDLCRAKERLL